MTKRKALAGLKQAIKTAAYIEAKTCTCNFCKAARRLQRQLKPVEKYLSQPRS